ncbi:unnamed protein product, partial [Chrysoparadoxa australica]
MQRKVQKEQEKKRNKPKRKKMTIDGATRKLVEELVGLCLRLGELNDSLAKLEAAEDLTEEISEQIDAITEEKDNILCKLAGAGLPLLLNTADSIEEAIAKAPADTVPSLKACRAGLQEVVNSMGVDVLCWLYASLNLDFPEEDNEVVKKAVLSKGLLACSLDALRAHINLCEDQLRTEAVRTKVESLTEQKRLAEETVEKLGGWRAAVFLDNGEVFVEADVSLWPMGDQVEMITTIKNELVITLEKARDELDSRNLERAAAGDLHQAIWNLWVSAKEMALAGEAADKHRASLSSQVIGEGLSNDATAQLLTDSWAEPAEPFEDMQSQQAVQVIADDKTHLDAIFKYLVAHIMEVRKMAEKLEDHLLSLSSRTSSRASSSARAASRANSRAASRLSSRMNSAAAETAVRAAAAMLEAEGPPLPPDGEALSPSPAESLAVTPSPEDPAFGSEAEEESDAGSDPRPAPEEVPEVVSFESRRRPSSRHLEARPRLSSPVSASEEGILMGMVMTEGSPATRVSEVNMLDHAELQHTKDRLIEMEEIMADLNDVVEERELL